MDVNDKIRELKQDIDKITSEEQATKSRIADLKRLVDERNKKTASLAKLKEEEAALLKELGL